MSNREGMNMHLGDALNMIERALSANQGQREVMLDDAIGVIRYVLKEEEEDEL